MATVIREGSESGLEYLKPGTFLYNLWRRRDLIAQFTIREIDGRYKGSFLGILWSFINPLVMLMIYTFVFGIVLKARWPNAKTDNLGEFAVTLFCGLIAFNVFNECVVRASSLVVGNPNYVKKVVFPLEILPVSVLGSAIFHSIISLCILLLTIICLGEPLHWTIIILPIVMLPLVCFSLGLSWFLASLGVFIRDINYTVILVMQVMFFLTPIFYPIENIPEPFRTVIYFNPLSSITENFRRVILWGYFPDFGELLVWALLALCVMLAGYAWFMKTKKGFADVI